MAEKTIKHGYFWYHQEEPQVINGEEKVVLVERTAFHNQTVDITRPLDLERGERVGAFYSDAELAERDGEPVEEESEEVELGSLPDDELVDYLLSTGAFDGEPKPTVEQVLDAVGDDKDLADRMLVAENTASGGESRKSLVEGLDKIKDAD